MKISEISEKIAHYLYENGCNGEVSFDWRTYDCEDDIPYLIIDGKRYKILDFQIDELGTEITITTIKDGRYWDYTFTPFFDEECEERFADTDEANEEYLTNMNVYGLLQDVYYETPKSWELGDFEMNFLQTA